MKIKKIIKKKIKIINLYMQNIKKNMEIDKDRYDNNVSIMRINEAGEISAQYLYYGQSFLVKEAFIKYFLLKSGKEEKKHLFWCIRYLSRYKAKDSLIKLLWEKGSFFIGNMPSIFNYKYSLGFLVETELQVSRHLEEQISFISKSDYIIMFIIKKMLIDEVKHANNAVLLRSNEIPASIKKVMGLVSFFMVNTAADI